MQPNYDCRQGSVYTDMSLLFAGRQTDNAFSHSALVLSNTNPSTLVEIINQELIELNNWFSCNKLHVNYDNTNYMIFRSRNKRIPVNLHPVSISQNIIKRKESTQFLGIVLDESLCWKKHINHISLKLSRSIGILSRLKYYLPSNILMMLYNSLLVPHFNYCNIILGYTYIT